MKVCDVFISKVRGIAKILDHGFLYEKSPFVYISWISLHVHWKKNFSRNYFHSQPERARSEPMLRVNFDFDRILKRVIPKAEVEFGQWSSSLGER